MRAVVYLRQSLDRHKTGAAIARQRRDCLALCEQREWKVVREYVDNDVSASSRKPRPEYTRMLAAVAAGEAEVIVAWHVDRLTRKLTDLENLIEVTQKRGVRVATVTGDVDLSNDAGRLVGRILASVARGEVERKSARQKRAQQQAAQQGRPAGGRRAFGYAKDGVTIDETEAKHIRQAYTDLLHGASLNGIARRWNDLGLVTTAGGPWRHDNVRSVLKNPRYAGLRTYRGEVVGPAIWKPLVDEDTHAAAVALLSMPNRRTTSSTARKYLLPGLALCWKCGSDVTTGHTRHGVRVYVCRAHKCVSRKAEPVDELVTALVIERLSRPDAVELLGVEDDDLVRDLRGRAQGIRERLNDLATGLEEGILTLGAVRRSSERLRTELARVEKQITEASSADVLGPLVDAEDVAAAWEGLDLAQRRAVVDTLMVVTLLKPEQGRNTFDPETVGIEWKGSRP